MNVLALCAGLGGLELGIKLALGESCRIAAVVEGEAYRAAVLAACMESGEMDKAPIWSDLRTFDGRPWRGVVDLVAAGYPCQPFSFAGKRAGTDDPRHLWPHVARVVQECAPSAVVLENVLGHLTLGFPEVRRCLEGMGYGVAAGVFGAAEVGANHERRRLFAIAANADADLLRPQGQRETEARAWTEQQLEGLLQDSVRNAVPAGRRSGMDDGAPQRSFRLDALGSGVIPLVGGHAFRTLSTELIGGAS